MRLELLRQSSLGESESRVLWKGEPLETLVFTPYPGVREFWIARDLGTGHVVGRIGASISAREPQRGYLGFFWLSDSLEVSDSEQVSRTLLDQACQYLSENGATAAIGPVAWNTWLPYRFLLRPADELRFSWEPNNPPSWPDLWEKSGFIREMNYCSEGFHHLSVFGERIRPAHENALVQGYRFVPIDHGQLINREISKLYSLSMAGFRDAHLFEPLSDELFRQLYLPLASQNARSELKYSCFIETAHGEPIGFSFNFVQGSRLILKTIAVLPEYRGRGLSNAAMYPGVSLALNEGIEDWVTALVRTGAQSESYGRDYPRVWRHDYVLYSKKLAPLMVSKP